MIQSNYIKGEDVPSFDEFVSAAIAEYGTEGGGKPMKIAVENFKGRIYRVLTSVGMGAYIHATSSLLDHGLKDILTEKTATTAGSSQRLKCSPKMFRKQKSLAIRVPRFLAILRH